MSQNGHLGLNFFVPCDRVFVITKFVKTKFRCSLLR